MWSVTNYTLKEENLDSNNIIVRIDNDESTSLIESISLYINPIRLKHLIPFSDPIDQIIEKKNSLICSGYSSLALAIKLRNKDNIKHVYDILNKINDDFITKKKEEKRFDDLSHVRSNLWSCKPILDSIIKTRDSIEIYICSSKYKGVQLTFEELANHGLIDRELFMEVYDDFAKKITQCL